MKKRVYFNLHKHVFSVKDKKTQRVAKDHRENVILDNVTFVVSEAGRQRVLQEKRKNVHAYVDGKDSTASVKGGSLFLDCIYEDVVQVTYNPYKYDSFVTLQGSRPLQGAERVFLNTKEITNKKGKLIRIPLMFAVNPVYK